MIYIEQKFVDTLIGRNIPIECDRFAGFLDGFLVSLAIAGDSLPMQLYEHNHYGRRERAGEEFAKVDADVTIEINADKNKLSADLRDYRRYPEFARNSEERRVVVHIVIVGPAKVKWVIHLPLQCLMKGFGEPLNGHQCYSHGITVFDNKGQPKINDFFYCGITGRNWLVRMSEHFREINKGSKKLFHRKWREYRETDEVLLNSELIVLNQSHTAAMDWEEWIVDRYKAEKKSLNMIPGGFKGQRFLYKFKYFKKKNFKI